MSQNRLKEFYLEGLDCANCAAKIEDKIKKIPKIANVQLHFLTQTLVLHTDDQEIIGKIQQIARSVEPDVKVYERTVYTKKDALIKLSTERTQRQWVLVRLIFGCTLLLVSFLPFFPAQYQIFPHIVIYGIIGFPVLFTALKKACRLQFFNEHFLMSVATIGAFAIGDSLEAIAVMGFYQFGEWLQTLAVHRSKMRIFSLVDSTPEYITLLRDGKAVQLPPSEAVIDDILIVKPGERISLDGRVLEGRSLVDTSALTGESILREVNAGEDVLATFINHNGLLKIKVLRQHRDSYASRMVDLIEQASTKKSKTEKWISRFAYYYTPIVVFSAVMIAILPTLLFRQPFESFLYRALVFLVISCPCALVLSVPLTCFIAIGRLSKAGILVKGSDFFSVIHRAKALVFDKTGTLTTGQLSVKEVIAYDSFSSEQIEEFAAYGESYSDHPIAKAIRLRYKKEIIPQRISEYLEHTGYGISFRLDGRPFLIGNRRFLSERAIAVDSVLRPESSIFVAVEGKHIGTITFIDQLRPNTVNTIRKLKQQNLALFILSGDHQQCTQEIAVLSGIENAHHGLLPDQKIEYFEKIQKEYGTAIYVGDGINDAPVLRRADAGIALGARSTDLTLEAADVVILEDDIGKIEELFEVSRKTQRLVWQNLVLIFGIKILFLTLGASGISSLWEAVFADVGVTLLCILNAMRLF